ncbi:MAG: DUF359 domain-containing protein [Methanobacteriota archaeon]
MNYMGALRLSPSLRAELKKPLGFLRGSLVGLEVSDLVCVGDVVSEEAIKLGLNPRVCIFDGVCKREEVGVSQAITSYEAFEVSVENPQGLITLKALEAVRESFRREGKTKIKVNGEEDLLTLPVILYAPEGLTVVYGQPNEGVVEVKVNENIKNKVGRIIEEMKNEH